MLAQRKPNPKIHDDTDEIKVVGYLCHKKPMLNSKKQLTCTKDRNCV